MKETFAIFAPGAGTQNYTSVPSHPGHKFAFSGDAACDTLRLYENLRLVFFSAGSGAWLRFHPSSTSGLCGCMCVYGLRIHQTHTQTTNTFALHAWCIGKLYHSIYISYLSFLTFFFAFRLKIKSAKLSDSGNYSCLPTMADGDSVTVHIINGKWCTMGRPWRDLRAACSNYPTKCSAWRKKRTFAQRTFNANSPKRHRLKIFKYRTEWHM